MAYNNWNRNKMHNFILDSIYLGLTSAKFPLQHHFPPPKMIKVLKRIYIRRLMHYCESCSATGIIKAGVTSQYQYLNPQSKGGTGSEKKSSPSPRNWCMAIRACIGIHSLASPVIKRRSPWHTLLFYLISVSKTDTFDASIYYTSGSRRNLLLIRHPYVSSGVLCVR